MHVRGAAAGGAIALYEMADRYADVIGFDEAIAVIDRYAKPAA